MANSARNLNWLNLFLGRSAVVAVGGYSKDIMMETKLGKGKFTFEIR